MKQRQWDALRLPLIAVALGLLVGCILIVLAGNNPATAYWALVKGSLSGVTELGRTLDKATPLVMGGLAVAVAFKAGLFNIGGQGQLLLGAAVAAYFGFRFSMPTVIHLPLAMAMGGLAAGLLGWLVGVLKATRGTHEVITTIMLNFVAANLTDWLTSRDGPWKDPESGAIARTPLVNESAEIPRLGGLPTGFLVAVLAAGICWWVFEKTNFGFEVRTTGLNPKAARYAGIKTQRIIVTTMVMSAFLAGVGGAIETQGVAGRFQPGFNTGLGFDGITIALLARTNPLAVVPAALLIGAMDAGSTLMQAEADVAPEIISVIQASILFFIAAPSVVRFIVRMRSDAATDDDMRLSSGWGA